MPCFERVFNASVLRGDWTGVEKAVCAYAANLLNSPNDSGGTVFLVPPGIRIPGIPEELHLELPRYTRWRAGRIFYELFRMPSLVKSLGASRFYGPAYLLPPRLGCHATLIVYDCHVFTCPRFCRLFNLIHYRLRMPWSVRRADRVIVPSERVRRTVVSLFHVPEEKIETIPIPQQAPICGALAGADEEPCRLTDNPLGFFLAVGAPSPRKNHGAVIKAWQMLPEPKPDLLITGGKAAPRRKDGSPSRVGYVTDNVMASLYAHAKALVYPSFDEGFGLPVAEAQAAGIPVITTASIAEEFPRGNIYICGTDAPSILDSMAAVLENSRGDDE